MKWKVLWDLLWRYQIVFFPSLSQEAGLPLACRERAGFGVQSGEPRGVLTPFLSLTTISPLKFSFLSISHLFFLCHSFQTTIHYSLSPMHRTLTRSYHFPTLSQGLRHPLDICEYFPLSILFMHPGFHLMLHGSSAPMAFSHHHSLVRHHSFIIGPYCGPLSLCFYH